MSLADGQLHELIESLLEKLDTGLAWEYVTGDQFKLSLETGQILLTRKVEDREEADLLDPLVKPSSVTSFKLVLKNKRGDTLGTLNESDESGENNLFTLFQQVKQRRDKDLIAFNAIMEELEGK
jgi:hypothetical protein